MHSLKSWFDMGDIGSKEARPILLLQSNFIASFIYPEWYFQVTWWMIH